MNLNKITVAGRLTRDPETRITPSGQCIAQFGIAINREWKDASTGAKKEEVTFLDCEAWGKTAEVIAKHFGKGNGIYCDGRLKIESWDDKTTGQKRTKAKVVVESFQFVGGRDDASSGTADAPPPTRQSAPKSTPPHQENIDEDVPF